jgi:hypothetical protein
MGQVGHGLGSRGCIGRSFGRRPRHFRHPFGRLTAHAHGHEHVVEQLAFRPGEGLTLLVVFLRWRIAHHHPTHGLRGSGIGGGIGSGRFNSFSRQGVAAAQNWCFASAAQSTRLASVDRLLQGGPIHIGNACGQGGQGLGRCSGCFACAGSSGCIGWFNWVNWFNWVQAARCPRLDRARSQRR